MAWIVEANKQFIILGNVNCITYKEVFPLFKENRMWLGVTNFNRGMFFRVPDDFEYAPTYKFERERNGMKVNRVPGTCWYTNVEHGRRHHPLNLMSESDNIRYSRHKEIKGVGYKRYDNYDAIEVNYFDAIPSDYEGIMGVSITFLDKYCPEQFEILWQACGNTRASAPKDVLKAIGYTINSEDRGGCGVLNGKRQYARILIRKKQS